MRSVPPNDLIGPPLEVHLNFSDRFKLIYGKSVSTFTLNLYLLMVY
jgi:hypothetical protein